MFHLARIVIIRMPPRLRRRPGFRRLNDREWRAREREVSQNNSDLVQSLNQDPEYRARQNAPLAERRRLARLTRAHYEEEIRDGPVNPCSCCGGLWPMKSLNETTVAALLRKQLPQDFIDRICIKRVSPRKIHLCGTCNKKVLKQIVPALCLATYTFPVIPEVLMRMSPLELRFVAPRIAFMHIRPLKYGPQYGLKGSIVNVPINIQDCVAVLPRQFHQMQTIQVRLMRQQHNRTPYMYETICPSHVIEGARYLLSQFDYLQPLIVLFTYYLDISLLPSCTAPKASR